MARMATVTCHNRNCKRGEQGQPKVFEARTADVARGWGTFCSKSCKAVEQEDRTGQYQAFKQRQSSAQYDSEMDGAEDQSWDAHKSW